MKKKKLLIREVRRLLGFLALGTFLIYFNQDIETWKYPLGFTQEVKEFMRDAGWIILIGGYPLSLIIRGLTALGKHHLNH